MSEIVINPKPRGIVHVVVGLIVFGLAGLVAAKSTILWQGILFSLFVVAFGVFTISIGVRDIRWGIHRITYDANSITLPKKVYSNIYVTISRLDEINVTSKYHGACVSTIEITSKNGRFSFNSDYFKRRDVKTFIDQFS